MDAGTAALEMSYWKDLRWRPFNILEHGSCCRVRIRFYPNNILGYFRLAKFALPIFRKKEHLMLLIAWILATQDHES